MKVTFNPTKNKINKQKHGISLADAEGVLLDPMAITIEDIDHEDVRFVSIGVDNLMRILVVVWCECGDDCFRLISARKAESQSHEIQKYSE